MAASLFLLATLFAGQLLAGWSSELGFVVFQGEWETCKRINSSMTCYQTRDVHCRAVGSEKPAPWRHCSAGGSKPRPVDVKECRQCQQDCVVTMWSEWTPCTGRNDVYTTRNRFVVAPPLEDGRPCPALRERKRCEGTTATISQLERLHTWRLGPWLHCEPLNGEDCGEGTRVRSVDCVDLQGKTVNQTLCLQEEAYLRLLPPPAGQLCEVPCPCQLSEWSDWSRPTPDCSLSTSGPVSRRSRSVQRHPTLGGRPCGALEELQIETGEVDCPVIYWETSTWSECTTQDEGASCGAGYRRRYTYCMEEDMDGVAKQIEPEKCNSTEQPTTLDPCRIPCYQQCRVSEWTAWSHCPNDTCEQILSYRNRTVLVEPHGYECPHLTEVRECPPIPCARWVPDEWSTCFPSFSQSCGWGTQSREIICQDPAGNIIGDNHCRHLELPSGSALCYKHCWNDTCVISDWGEWSACSETCGNTSGIQTRSRYVAVNTSGSCSHLQGELSQQQNCAVDTPCEFPVFHVEYSGWGECVAPANATQDGMMCSGVRTRTATCFRDGEEVLDSECVISSRLVEEPCSTPCSTDCVMSDWSTFSECSVSCIQTRRRRLLEFGEGCPDVDSSGLEIETQPCNCGGVYGWVAGDSWSTCQPFPTPLSQLSQNYVDPLIPDPGTLCGPGYQSRDIECRDEDGAVVDETLCDIRTKPPSVKQCVVHCSQRCVITDWTDYSLCNGSNMMQRNREILPFSGYDNYLDNCPELLSVAQVDEQTCPSHDFSKFVWTIIHEFGELHNCYLPPDKVCGPGERYKTIGCINTSVPESERIAADPEFCSRLPSPDTIEVCNDNCNIDCEYAQPGWSVWSPCSVTCGTGIQTRTRRVQRDPRGEGRPCSRLNETTTCEMPACNFFKYSYTPRSLCQPNNETLGCGDGSSTSDLLCLVNGVAQPNASACQPSLGLKAPQRIYTCSVPCDGDCVWSEWSSFKWCPECRSGCYRRSRHILRSGDDCEGTAEQFRPCPMDEAFWWTGDWTDCIVQGASQEDYCGAGIQRRKVECRQGNKGATYDEVCSHIIKPETARGCTVPCPIDCVVGSFSEWTSCGECSSELRATITRERHILVYPENGGRRCPHLTEERACPNLGCDEYFVETNTSALDCTAESTDGVCGLVSHNVLLCRRNTKYVELEECLRADASGKMVHNADLLHRHTDIYCNIECPVVEECHFTEFGPWSKCLHICDWSPEDTFQFRTRTLLSSRRENQEECHKLQQEVRVCSPVTRTTNVTREEESCIRFDWVSSKWYSNNTRDVRCHGRSSHVEDSACIKSLHPVTKRNADLMGICNCPFLSECDGMTTECFCREGFEMTSSLCLPVDGCVYNEDLLEESQQCQLYEVCNTDGYCVCPKDQDCPIDPTTPATPTGSRPSPTVTMATGGVETDPEGEETGTKPSDILMIVLIVSVPLLIFIVILLVVIICTCKCRQHLEKKHRRRPAPVILHQNQRLNNQSDTSKTPHDLKDGGVRVQEIAPETTSHPIHLHNGSASSGFVEEMEHYAQTSFNGYSQTQSDIDEATFAAPGNIYAPYPHPDDPPSVPFTPTTPHPPYIPFEIEERDSVPYHGSGMRPALQPHPFSRSLSEEAHLAGMGGIPGGRLAGGYDHRLDQEGPEFSQDLPEQMAPHGLNYYLPSPASSQAHPPPSHSHHHHHHGNGGRDNRIMAGMDMSMVRAIEQVSASEAGSRSPSVSSMGSRSSARRSGRRRHHHRSGHHRGDPRVHSPVTGPSHSAQGYYYGDFGYRDPYQSNTLPRSGSKTASPHMPSRSPRHHVMPEASPLVSKTTTPPGRYVRSASNEILEVRRHQPHLRPPLEESHDVSHDQQPPLVEMPPALPDEYPLAYHATNPLSTSPPVSNSQVSGEGDYDHIRPSGIKAPPPLPPVNLKPPTSTLAAPPQPNSSSSSPHSPRSPSSEGQQQQEFPQELTSAIQKRAKVIGSSPSPASSSPGQAPPPPPPRTVSSHQERRGRSRNVAARFSPAVLSAYNKGNPPTPPSRGSSSLQGQSNPLTSNHAGAPPPPPPPPPVRSS